jgi:hypothetical protein
MVYCVSGHFQQYVSYIVTVDFIGGGNRITRRKPSNCHVEKNKTTIIFYISVL